MLVLSATLKARTGAAPALLALSKKLIPLSRAEPGCIRYDFLQDTHEPDRFVFFELWKSRADLDLHFETAYFKELAEALPNLVEGSAEILTYETDGPKAEFQ